MTEKKREKGSIYRWFFLLVQFCLPFLFLFFCCKSSVVVVSLSIDHTEGTFAHSYMARPGSEGRRCSEQKALSNSNKIHSFVRMYVWGFAFPASLRRLRKSRLFSLLKHDLCLRTLLDIHGKAPNFGGGKKGTERGAEWNKIKWRKRFIQRRSQKLTKKVFSHSIQFARRTEEQFVAFTLPHILWHTSVCVWVHG